MSAFAVTPNGLRDGEVVFYAEGRWVKDFAAAELFGGRDPGETALAKAKLQSTLVVEPYVIDIVFEDGLPVPTLFRERVRALGPTIHPNIGKQAAGGVMVEVIRAHAGGGTTFDAAEDRIMLCGSMAMIKDAAAILETQGLREGSNADPGEFVLERAFVG